MGMWQKQLGKIMKHPNQSQPNPGKRADGTPCTCATISDLVPIFGGPTAGTISDIDCIEILN